MFVLNHAYDRYESEIGIIRDYLQKEEYHHHLIENTDLPEGLDLKYTSSYVITSVFGDKLLKSSNTYIRDLFNLGAFVLYHGLSNAVHLIKTKQYDDLLDFKDHLFTLAKFDNLSSREAGELEYHKISFYFAHEYAECEDFVAPNSTTKHLRNNSLIKYATIAQSIINRFNKTQLLDDNYKSIYTILTDTMNHMLRYCNISNLKHKMTFVSKSDLCILQDLLEKYTEMS